MTFTPALIFFPEMIRRSCHVSGAALTQKPTRPMRCSVPPEILLSYFESGFHILKNAFLNAMMFLEVGLNDTLASTLDQFPNDGMIFRMGSGWCSDINTSSRLPPFFFFIHTNLWLLPKFASWHRMCEHSSSFLKCRESGDVSARLYSSEKRRASVDDWKIWLKQNAMLLTNVQALFAPFSELRLPAGISNVASKTCSEAYMVRFESSAVLSVERQGRSTSFYD